MSNFDEVLQDDATNAFCNSDDFAESVRWQPRGGSIATYYAQVFRDPVQKTPGGPQVKMEVHLTRDPDSVKGPASINTGGDKIELKYRVGGSADWYEAIAIARQDTGMWVLNIR